MLFFNFNILQPSEKLFEQGSSKTAQLSCKPHDPSTPSWSSPYFQDGLEPFLDIAFKNRQLGLAFGQSSITGG